MVTKTTIQNKIAEYLADETSLADLQNWLAPHAWSITAKADPEVSKLIYSLELRIAEYDSGHLPRKEFLAELEELAYGALEAKPTASRLHLVVVGETTSFEYAGSLLSTESSSFLVRSQ